MFVKRSQALEWMSAGYAGAERALLRLSKEEGRTSIVRIKAGSRGPRHTHAAGEDVLVISGKVRIGDEILNAGDYMYTEPGEEHFLEAIEDSVIYASTPRPIKILE
jgi:quercetin dioxygenase-like cupin family protein